MGTMWVRSIDACWGVAMGSSLVRRVGSVSVAVLGLVAVAASGTSSTDSAPGGGSSAHPAEKDVAITACALSGNDLEGPSAKLTITNNSSKKSNYIITVAFESPDGSQQLDTATTSVNNLEPDQSSVQAAVSFDSDLRDTPFECRISDVTRMSAVG